MMLKTKFTFFLVERKCFDSKISSNIESASTINASDKSANEFPYSPTWFVSPKSMQIRSLSANAGRVHIQS